MKKYIVLIFILIAIAHYTFGQTTLTVDANDVLSSNTKIVAQTAGGQSFFTGHQLGGGYSYPYGIFRAATDNPAGAYNYFYDGVTNGNVNFSVRADGQGYFAGHVGIGTTTPGDLLTVSGYGNVRDVVGSGQGFVGYDTPTGGNHIFSMTRQVNNLGISAFDGIGFTPGATNGPSSSYAMYIAAGGNVGRGTISPRTKLDFANVGSFPNDIIGFYNGGLNVQYGIGINLTGGNDAVGGLTLYSGDRGIVFRNNNISGTELMSITNSGNFHVAGNVGIGTTSPTANLTLGGSGNSNPNPGAETDYNGLNITFKGESIGQNFNLGSIKMVQPNGYYLDASDMVFSTSYSSLSEKMRITRLGNVGIGTTNPSAKLQVNSNNIGSGGVDWIAGNFGATAGDRVVMGLLYGVATIGSHNNALNAWSNLAINTDGGNVSIGTTDAKGYKLAVNGSAIATSMTVKLYGNWPDYVFEPNYTLKPLSEVKTYIDENHHLPDMPSAAEVEKGGLNLGEMNKLLVKKVEELTLYLIEKDKQLNHQQEQINEMNKKIESLVYNKTR